MSVHIQKVDSANDAELSDLGNAPPEVTDRRLRGERMRWALVLLPDRSHSDWLRSFSNFDVGEPLKDDSCSDLDAVIDLFEKLLGQQYGSVERQDSGVGVRGATGGRVVARWSLGPGTGGV